jgi:hypothetical protein
MSEYDHLAQTAFAKIARVDPPRVDLRTGLPERQHRIRVICRPLNQVLPGGHMVESGENFLFVYTTELGAIRLLVEQATEDDWRRVRTENDRRVRKWQSDNPESSMDMCPHSIEAAFEYVMERSMRPLEKVEELDAPTLGAAP